MKTLQEVLHQMEIEESHHEKVFVANVLVAVLFGIRDGIPKERLLTILRIFVDSIENQL